MAVKFDAKNYDLGEQVIETALKAKNKLGLINGKMMKLAMKGGKHSTKVNAREMVSSMINSGVMKSNRPKVAY